MPKRPEDESTAAGGASAGDADDDLAGGPPDDPPTDRLEAELARAEVQRRLFGVEASGPKLGRYELRERVGAGAMGAVYLARDVELRRDVALKVIHPRDSDEKAQVMRRRLLREARAMAKLRHPNVIAVFEATVVDDQAFIAMEYVDGASLREWLEAEPRSWQQVLEVFEQAGRGLAAAHEVGLVHRDFKPDNALIDRDGRVQVTDFGVAQPLEIAQLRPEGEAASGPVSQTMGATDLSHAGTPRYMAPEQYAGDEVDARTDQFGFCVALFEALYHEPPFAGTTLNELATAAAGGDVSQPADRRQVPRWLHRVLMRGLEPDPAGRFQSMSALLDELAASRRPRRRWLLPLFAVAAAAAVAFAFGPSGSSERTVDSAQPTARAIDSGAAPNDEQALTMAAALVSDALADAVAAALRSGAADPAASTSATSGPEACGAQRPACRILGRCSHRDGRCQALASEQCKTSEVCRLSGMCSAVGGKCVVASDDDCAVARSC